MKKCSKCGKLREITDFHFRNKKKKTRKSSCKFCFSSYRKGLYHKKKSYYIKLAKESKERRLITNRKKLFNFLSVHACVDCGESDPIVLEFDHISDKKYGISDLMCRSKAWKTIEKEIKKCKVRCANCHRKKTAK